MRNTKTLLLFSAFTALLAALSAGFGLFYRAEGGSFDYTTMRGQDVEIFGRDIYRFDTLEKVATFRGADAVVLFAAVPALFGALAFYRRSSRVHLLLTGLLAIFLYHSLALVFGVAYNPLFLIYTAYFSASFFGFLLAFSGVDLPSLAQSVSPRMPRRGIAIFFFIAGLAVAFVWLAVVVEALLQGGAPEVVSSYTTEVTFVLDLAITVPVTIFAALSFLRGRSLAYALVPTLLILYSFVGLLVVVQTFFMLSYGLTISPAEFIMFVGTFLLMSLIAGWLAVLFFRNIQLKMLDIYNERV
jgi:hypothetical protein